LRRWKSIENPIYSQVTLLDYGKLEGDQEKQLFIQQRYFYLSASLRDIIRRFKKRPGKCDFALFPEKVCFLLIEAYSALAIVELLRILLDEEKLSFW
jgi:glycogen phosphorylase